MFLPTVAQQQESCLSLEAANSYNLLHPSFSLNILCRSLEPPLISLRLASFVLSAPEQQDF